MDTEIKTKFGRAVINAGFCSKEQVLECIEIKQRLADERKGASLASIMVQKGYITADDVNKLKAMQSTQIISCPSCGAKYNAGNLSSGQKIRCLKCDNVFSFNENEVSTTNANETPKPKPNPDKAVAEGQALAHFKISKGEQKGNTIPLAEGMVLTMGRAPNNDYKLAGVALSRVHTQVQVKDGVVTLTDLNSSNGTFVNDEKIHQKELKNEDLIRMGDIELVFTISHEVQKTSKNESKTCSKCNKNIPTGEEVEYNNGLICHACSEDIGDNMIGQMIGGCEVLNKLGEGGMGAVYKAHQKSMDRIVALKALLPNKISDESVLKRFLREAKSGAQLAHQNIIQLYDMGVSDDGIHYIIMEFVEGKTLQDYINEVGQLPWKEAAEIVLQVADALNVAYAKKIVHRDIKPENILFTEDNIVKLADLGLAKKLDDGEGLTRTGVAVGTPYYMPPEQIRDNKSVDHRSDIYSLGVTFFHMVTGTLPFKGKNVIEVVKKIIKEELPDPILLQPKLPKKVSEIILKMTAKKPDNRYKNPEDLCQDLEKIID